MGAKIYLMIDGARKFELFCVAIGMGTDIHDEMGCGFECLGLNEAEGLRVERS